MFNYATETLNTKQKLSKDKLDQVLKRSNCAAKVNQAIGSILKNEEDGSFRNFNAQENNNLLDRSKLVCTKDDLVNVKHTVDKTTVIESCTREGIETKWIFYKLKNLTVLAALLNVVPIGRNYAVSIRPLLKTAQPTVSRLKGTQGNHIMTICAFFVHLFFVWTEIKNWNEKHQNFQFLHQQNGWTQTPQFKGVHMHSFPVVDEQLHPFGIDFVDAKSLGELAMWSVQKYKKTLRLLRYKAHLCFMSNINTVLQTFCGHK